MRLSLRLSLIGLVVLLLAGCAPLRSLFGPAEVVIEWEVESEQGTAGYNLLRAESADGPFAKVNEALIPAQGDPVVTHKYSYTDRAVTCGTTYWYKLQEVETSGALNTIEEHVTQVTACQ